ncbi:MAG TPA: helix-turn-helix domain-containing protein, partial [Micrococcaceae bacterium]
MSTMTAQLPLPTAMVAGAVPVGLAASLVEDKDGGRVFVHGELSYAWNEGETATRRFAAVKLADIKAASVAEIAAAFGVEPGTLWRWRQALATDGVLGLAPEKPGPKGPSRLTEPMKSRIRTLRAAGQPLRAVGAAVGVSEFTVRRALAMETPPAQEPAAPRPAGPEGETDSPQAGPVTELPVLPAAADRSGERARARTGLLECAAPVFAPAARVPLAGLLLALPALEATGLLECARETFGALPNEFYGLETILTGAVFAALAGEPRAERTTRIDPVAMGRVLGLDRAPEVKTLRRKMGALAGTGKAGELLTAIAAKHLHAGGGEGNDGGDLAAVLYVDGHVRAYQGTRKIGKVHSTRLKFPVPATEETWVADAHGAPVLVVMAEPGAALTGELRRLLPTLRSIIGDDRR